MRSLQYSLKSLAIVRPKNRLALALLHEWMADEDTGDDAKLEQFEAELQRNRVVFNSLQDNEV